MSLDNNTNTTLESRKARETCVLQCSKSVCIFVTCGVVVVVVVVVAVVEHYISQVLTSSEYLV